MVRNMWKQSEHGSLFNRNKGSRKATPKFGCEPVTRSTRDKGTQAEAERDGKFGEETEISRIRASG